ncbi:MAG: DNA mismatch repair protein MutS [Chlorobi bacterium]|nr:DNA mismatch repair protein MutS [Chlorobiota bacterium]
MAYIHPKVLEDLDFDSVRRLTLEKTDNPLVRRRISEKMPAGNYAEVADELQRTDEYLKGLQSGNFFPSSDFKPFGEELDKLSVKNIFLEAPVFLKLARAVETMIEWKKFLKKFASDYPAWSGYLSLFSVHPQVAKEIRTKISRTGEVKDQASPELEEIRRRIREWRRQRDDQFSRLVAHFDRLGYLDEIKESVAGDKPVLAVKAMYKRQVKGQITGTSRSGSIIFIEPQATAEFNRRLQILHADEKAEIIKILKALTDFLRPFAEDLQAYEHFLTEAEFSRAKALLAQETDAVLPQIVSRRVLHLRQAYHPLLKWHHRHGGKPVVPHDIELNPQRRIMVISGPNAGGKSITLKTVGLIQLMLQAGWLVPVHPESKMPFFGKILSDVGDHQSVENELSTYSYRLKNMKLFLRLADVNTLFLIDEFGSGTDPDLGGALAEVFLEEFSRSGAYGIITTHYNNLKHKAGELEGVFNAYMEFDAQRLEPTYRLVTGQPGSSFTFEIAAKMGIPYSLINRAKKKTSRQKVRFDRTLSQLQEEKKNLRQSRENYLKQSAEAERQRRQLEDEHLQILKKLEAFRQLYETERHTLEAGRKILQIFRQFQKDKDKKKLWKSVNKWIDKEFVRQQKTSAKKIPAKHEKKWREQVHKELSDKDVKKELTRLEIKKMTYIPKPGDRVRLKGSTANATLERIENDIAVLNYGRFTAKVPLQDLELVMRKG